MDVLSTKSCCINTCTNPAHALVSGAAAARPARLNSVMWVLCQMSYKRFRKKDRATCYRIQISLKRQTSLFCPVYDFISLTSRPVVQCHFQASWQREHVRLWRWTRTAANHGGPSPGRRPAAPVRRARSLELQEPGPPVWTVRGGGSLLMFEQKLAFTLV